MNTNEMNAQESYQKHALHLQERVKSAQFWEERSVNDWRAERLYGALDPIIQSDKSASWLTVGDGYGADAHYLLKSGVIEVLASDIEDSILSLAKASGRIKQYAALNAEAIDLEDNAYDFVLCKEALHHFPRPYLALSEMTRVAKRAVIFMEPVDIALSNPAFLLLKNLGDRLPKLFGGLWKNRYSFETVGNYVYKFSKREVEKFAMGMGLRHIAFGGINDVHDDSPEMNERPMNQRKLRQIQKRIKLKDRLCATDFIPKMHLIAVIGKGTFSDEFKDVLNKSHFQIQDLPLNPYA
ncbi:class I SAM-dependent methyltransferase [Persicobacter diffluens]